jgi:hypothetical protein
LNRTSPWGFPSPCLCWVDTMSLALNGKEKTATC